MRGMLLAAGLGTRLRPYTDILPKAAIPLLNIPLGYYPLFHLLNAGVTDLVINKHHLPHKVEELFKTQSSHFKTLNFTHETPAILGSGGGINHAKKLLGESSDFFVANGDEVFLPTSDEVFDQLKTVHRQKKPIATLLVMKHPEVGTKFGGVWADKTGSVKGFGKTAPGDGVSPYHYTGFMILNRGVFDYIPSGIESNIFYDVLVKAIADGKPVQIVSAWGDWFETGNKEDLMIATRNMLSFLPQNRVLQDICETFVPNWSLKAALKKTGKGTLLLAPSARIEETYTITGFATIGDGSVVGAGSRLQDVIVGSQVYLGANSQLENELILK